jgi:hypothetical protein
VIQSQEPTHSQAEGIQPIDAPSNEPQQPVTAYFVLHHILIEQEERREPQYLQLFNF